MPFPNIFKKKEEDKEKEEEKKEEKKKEEEPAAREEQVVSGKPQKFGVIQSPYITEKTMDLTRNNQYTFKVDPEANKIEIRKAIESLYNVDVIGVQTDNVSKKRRGVGRTSGWKKGFKKAMVRVKEGQRIEDFYQ
ncbi:MAG: 50S ribosomal protein L23 [Candidatus Nealsonbacteria bacterium]|nr:50S ribosomal protein L23 [Candidatus Nealsonbacteria bacterium]